MLELNESYLVRGYKFYDSFNLALAVLFITLLFVFAYTPTICLYISVVLLLVPIKRDNNLYKAYLLILQFFIFFSMLVSALSEPIFLFQESDFTHYYNNYLLFLNHGFSTEYFEWGGGVEIGLPLVNYALTFVVGAETPIIIKLYYCSIQLFLFFSLILLMKRNLNLSLSQYALLLAFSIIFLKFGAIQNHLRQGISSLLLLMAIFSNSRKKHLYLTLSIMFHLSAIIIYPLIKFLIVDGHTSKKYKFLAGCLISAFIILFAMPFFLQYADFIKTSIFSKLIWTVYRFTDEDFVISSIKTTIIGCTYYVPLLVLLITAKSQNAKHIKLSILSIIVFALSFSYLPGFAVRIISPILLILTGFFYFKVCAIRFSLKVQKMLIFFTWTLVNINWIFFAVFYYYQFPVIAQHPFAYMEELMQERSAVQRQNLPWFKDVFK